MPHGLTVGGISSVNGSTVFTVLRLCVCARFSRFKLHVFQVHLRRVHFVDAETTSLKGGTSRRPNFFVFRPIEVPKEPK
jgi:hypothetical protein